MTIVIKTQDNWNNISKLVFNPIRIEMDYLHGKDAKILAITECNTEALGTYKSESKGQRIIDDIYSKLNDMHTYKDNAGCMVFTYQMPKE